MPTIKISKVKPRRGTDAQRLALVFDQGELVSTTDSKRLFIGTGTLSGGVVLGSKIHSPVTNYSSLSNVVGEVGDLVNANNKFYQLTSANYSNINNWVDVSTKLESTHFHYDNLNNLSLTLSSVSVDYIDPSTVSNGLVIRNNILQTNYNPKNFALSSTQLRVNASGIDELEINSSTFTKGISGGSGNKIGLNVDTNYFYFNGNTLSLSGTPDQAVTFLDLSASWFGNGLIFDYGGEKITTVLANVDGKTILKSLTGQIYVNPSTYGTGLVYNATTPLLSTVLTSVDGTTLSKDLSGKISINQSIFGNGLVYNTTSHVLSASLGSTDNVSLTSNESGVISIKRDALSGTNNWPQITVDSYGRVTNHRSSILDVLTGNSNLGTFNDTNTLSAIFNGDAMGLSGLQITQFTALSSDGSTVINLSSAGFITFEGNTTTRNGNTVGRFAIPIFTY